MAIAYQLLSGLNTIHSYAKLMHRDVKPTNILISEPDLTFKYCDFGQTRVSPEFLPEELVEKKYTLEVGSRWYKAPEILFGCR